MTVVRKPRSRHRKEHSAHVVNQASFMATLELAGMKALDTPIKEGLIPAVFECRCGGHDFVLYSNAPGFCAKIREHWDDNHKSFGCRVVGFN